MSTGANIKVPFQNQDYYVESDGYPQNVVPYLESIVEDAKENAEEKYTDPDEYWVEQLQLEFDDRTGGMYPELVLYNNQFCSYNYKITEDGEVLYREERNDEWKTYSGDD